MDNSLYDYTPLPSRPTLEWPNGARLAFYVGVNVESFQFDDRFVESGGVPGPESVPNPMNYGWRDYGPRVGIWRMMEALDRFGLKASVLLNADVARSYPEIIAAGRERGWAWLAHGKTNSILQWGMSPDREQEYLHDVVDTIAAATGYSPKGWLGPALTETFATATLLSELGVTYLLDWCCDDQPFPLRIGPGRMISVPYSVEMNDMRLFLRNGFTGSEFLQAVVDQFDQLYRDSAASGRVMALALHPFLINQPHRHRYLCEALEYITGHEDVWLTTSDDIADWYLTHY